MPVLMTLSMALVITWATTTGTGPLQLRAFAVGSWAFGLATTILVKPSKAPLLGVLISFLLIATAVASGVARSR